MKRCPYCGEKVKQSAAECTACERTFGKSNQPKQSQTNDPRRLSNLDSYRRSIPTWVFVLAVLLGVLCLVLVFIGPN